MEYVPFGNTGLSVSRLALGTEAFALVNRARGWDPFSQAGFLQACEVIRASLAGGVNVIDSHVDAGEGHAQTIIGEALKNGTRHDVSLCVRFPLSTSPADLETVVKQSLARLQTTYIDMLVIDAGLLFVQEGGEHLYDLMEPLHRLKIGGRIRLIGLAAQNATAMIPFARSGLFDMMLVNYSIIYQEAALGLLGILQEYDMGVMSIHSMASGVYARQVVKLGSVNNAIARANSYCLKYLLSDDRVHTMRVSMRTVDEVEENIAIVDRYNLIEDFGYLPRTLKEVYRLDDEEHA